MFWWVPPKVFPGMAHLVFLIFGTIVDNSNTEKLTEPFFQENFFLDQIWAERAQNGPKIVFLGFFEKFCHVTFCCKLLIFHQHIWHNFGFQVMGQNVAGQSNCRIL